MCVFAFLFLHRLYFIMTEDHSYLFKSCLSLPMMEFFPSQKQSHTPLQTSCADQLSGAMQKALYHFVHMYGGYILCAYVFIYNISIKGEKKQLCSAS